MPGKMHRSCFSFNHSVTFVRTFELRHTMNENYMLLALQVIIAMLMVAMVYMAAEIRRCKIAIKAHQDDWESWEAFFREQWNSKKDLRKVLHPCSHGSPELQNAMRDTGHTSVDWQLT